MKKTLLFGLLILGSITLAGCHNPLKDIFNPIEGKSYSEVAQICKDNDGEITTDELGNDICLFNAHDWCLLEKIQDGTCEWLNHEPGGEWITEVIDMCEEQGGTVEGQDLDAFCYYEDKTFCYLEDLPSGSCKKGDVSLINDGYPYAEQACIDNNGQISQTEDGEDICILSDDEFCYMSDVIDGGCDLLYQDMLDIQDMHEDEKAYQEYVAECYNQPQITVCGEDGNSYYNRCFMEKAGVEEETELAEVVDGECVFG